MRVPVLLAIAILGNSAIAGCRADTPSGWAGRYEGRLLMTRYFSLPVDRSPESRELLATLTLQDAPAQTLRLTLTAPGAIPGDTGEFTMVLDTLGQAAAAAASECLVGQLADGALETLCADVATATRQDEQLSLAQVGHLHGDIASNGTYAGSYVVLLEGVRQ